MIDGIYASIAAEFGAEYKIYTEETEELNGPCFSIVFVDFEQGQALNTRRNNLYQMCVKYHPKSKGKQLECGAIVGRLAESLEQISVDGCQIRGKGIRAELTEQGLECTVYYSIVTQKVEEVTYMSGIAIDTGLKE